MAIQDNHAEYNKYAPQWKRCRDASDGQDAIFKAGEAYLPKLSDQTNDEYKAYQERGLFFDATYRTIQGLSGMIFRKPADIQENGMAQFIEDVTLKGDSLRGFAEDITGEVLEVGRVGVLVEYHENNSQAVTQAQVEALNMRPYFHKYKAESIINWRTDRINNKNVLSQIRLSEIIEVQKDEFEYEYIDQIRILDLNEGVYRQRVFQKEKDKSWVLISEVIPLRNGSPMDFIPFVFISPNGTNPSVEKPPLIGLVNVNISHYKTTADLEHGAHFTGLPTAVVTGITNDDAGEFRIGSGTAWTFTNENADAKYLEFTGQGLGTLERRDAYKVELMASLGAQMLTPQTRRNEAVDTAAMRHMGENSILSNIAQAISEGLNICFEYAAQWLNIASPATIELNRDFMPTPMTPQMLKELVSSWQMGAISYNTLFEQLKEGEIIAPEKTVDEEQDELQSGDLKI